MSLLELSLVIAHLLHSHITRIQANQLSDAATTAIGEALKVNTTLQILRCDVVCVWMCVCVCDVVFVFSHGSEWTETKFSQMESRKLQ